LQFPYSALLSERKLVWRYYNALFYILGKIGTVSSYLLVIAKAIKRI